MQYKKRKKSLIIMIIRNSYNLLPTGYHGLLYSRDIHLEPEMPF